MSSVLFPYPTVPVIDLSEAESWEIASQDMKRTTRKRKALAQFQQSPTRPAIHRNAWRNSVVKSRKQLRLTVD